MRSFLGCAVAFTGLAMFTLPAGAGEYSGPGFAADMLFAQNGGEPKPMGKIYMSRKTMRYEAGGSIVLVDLASGRAATLMPDQKMYMEMPSGQGMAPSYDEKACGDYKNGKELGAETVNGRKTIKWRCIGQKPHPGVEPADSHVWYDDKLKYWIRSVRDTGDVTELRNVVIGKQPATLFVIPDGYQQFNMVSAQQMQQQMMERQDAYMRQMQQEQEAQRRQERERQQMETMTDMMELLLQNQE